MNLKAKNVTLPSGLKLSGDVFISIDREHLNLTIVPAQNTWTLGGSAGVFLSEEAIELNNPEFRFPIYIENLEPMHTSNVVPYVYDYLSNKFLS